MSSIGPQLPPDLSKRKRPSSDEEDPSSPSAKHHRSDAHPSKANTDEIALDDGSDSDDGFGPSAPAPSASIGPSIPAPAANNEEIDLESDSDSDTGPAPPPTAQSKPAPAPAPKPSVAGPTLPSSHHHEPHANEASSESDSDDYGPALPSSKGPSNPNRTIGPSLPSAEDTTTPQRDDWMLAPPTSSAYSERDPTRIRARKFASKPTPSGRGGAGGNSEISSIWTETPEEKLQRLQDSVLGRKDPANTNAASSSQQGQQSTHEKEKAERDRQISAKVEAQRGKSLYDEHQMTGGGGRGNSKGGERPGEEEEDDPSKRAFDREKDMALGGKIGTAQRKEFISKAAGFGGRFQKGSYL